MIILRNTKKMEVILFCAHHCCLAIPGTRANAGSTPATLGHLPTRSLALAPALVGLGSTKVSSLGAPISSWNLVKRYYLVPRSTHGRGLGRMPSRGFLVASKFLSFIQIALLSENSVSLVFIAADLNMYKFVWF